MDFKDECFDLIICNHVLEHIEDDKSALNEIYRVLKYNGISFLQVPINLKREKTFEDPSIKSKIEREEFYGQYDHVREYGLDFKDRVEQAGFKVEMLNYSTKISKDLIIKYGLLKNDLIPMGKKLPSNYIPAIRLNGCNLIIYCCQYQYIYICNIVYYFSGFYWVH